MSFDMVFRETIGIELCGISNGRERDCDIRIEVGVVAGKDNNTFAPIALFRSAESAKERTPG